MKNTRKLMIVVVFIIIGVSILVFKNYSGRTATLEESLNGIEPNNNVIHVEDNDKGSVVFRIKKASGYDYLETIIVDKNIFGYDAEFVSTAAINNPDDVGFTIQYISDVKGIPSPIYLGVITNEKIEKVSIKAIKDSEVRDTRVIEAGGKRIWFKYMEDIKGEDFKVVGYDKNGEIVYSVDDSIMSD